VLGDWVLGAGDWGLGKNAITGVKELCGIKKIKHVFYGITFNIIIALTINYNFKF